MHYLWCHVKMSFKAAVVKDLRSFMLTKLKGNERVVCAYFSLSFLSGILQQQRFSMLLKVISLAAVRQSRLIWQKVTGPHLQWQTKQEKDDRSHHSWQIILHLFSRKTDLSPNFYGATLIAKTHFSKQLNTTAFKFREK